MRSPLEPALRSLLLGIVLVVAACAPRAALIEGGLVEDLQAGQRDGAASFDHGTFDGVLRRHVRHEAARVDYASLRAEADSAGVHPGLRSYADAIAAVDLRTLGREEQMALLINAYNAFTLTLILEHYPGLASIRDIGDPWGTERWVVGGHKVSLDHLEHGVLRPLYRDPRVHFAINCASVGCPPLRDRAFTGGGLQAQLEAAATDTLSRPEYASRDGGRLALTSLLKWFGEDFVDPAATGAEATVQAWVAAHAPAPLAEFVRTEGPGIRWLDYDWRLNDSVSAH